MHTPCPQNKNGTEASPRGWGHATAGDNVGVRSSQASLTQEKQAGLLCSLSRLHLHLPVWFQEASGALGRESRDLSRARGFLRSCTVITEQDGTQAPESLSQLGWSSGAQPQAGPPPPPLLEKPCRARGARFLGNVTKHLPSLPERGAGGQMSGRAQHLLHPDPQSGCGRVSLRGAETLPRLRPPH